MINSLKKFSYYTKTILLLNVCALAVGSLFIFSGWDKELTEFMRMSVFYDLAVLFFALPIYVLWLRKLMRELKSKRVSDLLYWGFFAAMGLAIFGLGVHITANQISYIHQSDIVEYYDEYLGHVFALFPAFIFTFLFMFAQSHAPVKALNKLEFAIVSGLAVSHGSIGALALLESRGGGISLIVGVIVIVYSLYVSRNTSLRRVPIITYHLAFFIAMLLVLGLWWMVFGDFAEPSSIDFGRFKGL